MTLSEAQTFLRVEEVTQVTLQKVTKAKLLELANTLQLTLPDRVRKGERIVAIAQHLELSEAQSESLKMARIQLQMKLTEYEK